MPDTEHLHWDPDRSDALVVVSGSGWLHDFNVGEIVRLVIVHSADAIFAFAEPPRFHISAAIYVRLLLEGTDGHQFAVEIERILGAPYGADYGYGYGYHYGEAGDDFHYTWTRRGVIM